MEKVNEKKKSKIFSKIMKAIRILVFVLLGGFIFVVCLQRFSDNEVSFFKYRMFAVISGSMKPKYDIGDILISKEVNPSTIKVGDTISYLGEKGSFRDKVITHQVIGVNTDEDGKYVFRARGLANIVEDPMVSESQLYGVVIYKAVILSLIYRIVSTELGFYLFILVPLMFIIGSEIISTLLSKEEERRKNMNNI